MVPMHLAGNNAPVDQELTLKPSRVAGAIPPELDGQYLRNGPNPRGGWSQHAFTGDGMIHAITLGGGAAGWYRNRYVRTPLFDNPGRSRMELAFDPATGTVGYRVSTANTSVLGHAGHLLALEEGGLPWEVTAELETVGPYDFGGALRTPMTAHPKTCPATGELLFFGARLRPPFLTYYRASPTGQIVHAQPIEIPAAVMMHDFAITEHHVVFLDLPVVFDLQTALTTGLPWRWDDGHGARFGVMPRDGSSPVRWFEIEPCYVWHTMNAFESPEGVTVIGSRVASLWREGSTDLSGGLPALHEWTLDLGTGRVRERCLDDTPLEYPRVADADLGRRHRYGYTVAFSLDPEPDHGEVYAYDLRTGSRQVHRFPAGHTCGEAVHVPSSRHRDGYLMTIVHDRAEDTSYLAILDAADPAAAPVAEIHVPVRIPGGFHGTWLPGGGIKNG